MTPTPEEEIQALRRRVEAASVLDPAEAKLLRDAAERDNRRWRISLAFLIIGGPLLFAMTTYLTYRESTDTARDVLIRKAVSCLLAETDSHRINNNAAHDAIMRAQGLEIGERPQELLLTPEQIRALRGQCQEFIRVATGGASPPRAEANHE
jgi:hypothetical protein